MGRSTCKEIPLMTIHVDYQWGITSWKISQMLAELEKHPSLGFDIETAGVYTKAERKQAEGLLKGALTPAQRSEYNIVASNSGLSHPSLVRTTHFVFGIRNDYSVVLVTPTEREEMLVWNWVKNYKGRLVIHNTLFDLKIMYHRVGVLPHNYVDTALFAKCLINNADNFRSLIGLKELMGNYYSPSWALFDSYEPEDLTDPTFLLYAATDGAAVVHLWEDLQQYTKEYTA